MKRRTFIKASAGALGISAVGSFGVPEISVDLGEPVSGTDISIRDEHIKNDYILVFEVTNETDIPLKTDYNILYYDEGTQIKKDDMWPDNTWIRLDPGETRTVEEALDNSATANATSIEVTPNTVDNDNSLIH